MKVIELKAFDVDFKQVEFRKLYLDTSFENIKINDIVYWGEYWNGKLLYSYGLVKGFFCYSGEIYIACLGSKDKNYLLRFKDLEITPEEYGFWGLNIRRSCRMYDYKKLGELEKKGIVDKRDEDMLWGAMPLHKVVLAKGGEFMVNKYEELKEKIKNLNNGWDKEADDILQEILSYCDEEIVEFEIKFLSHEGLIRIKTKPKNSDMYTADYPVNFNSQCSRNEAFKKILLYLLNKTNLKKEVTLKEKISKLENELSELKQELKKLLKGGKVK